MVMMMMMKTHKLNTCDKFVTPMRFKRPDDDGDDDDE